MPDRTELSPEMSQRLDGLVDRIAGAHEAPDDLRRELRVHLEDKAAAFLSGEQRLGEADVLLLVEKHFGDSQRLRELMCEPHGFGLMKAAAGEAFTAGIFFRRLAAVIVATVIASIVAQFADLLWMALIPAQPERGDGRLFYWLSIVGTPTIFSLVLLMLLNWWRSQPQATWFIQTSPRRLLIVATLALSARWLIPNIGFVRSIPAYFVYDADFIQVIIARFLIQLPALIWILFWVGHRGKVMPNNRRTILDGCAAALICLSCGRFIGPLWSIAASGDQLYAGAQFPPRIGFTLLGLPDPFALLVLAIAVGYFIIAIAQSRRALHTPPLQPA